MSTVNTSTKTWSANGAAVAGTVTKVECTNTDPSYGFTVGVFKDEAGTVVVSTNPSLSGTAGNAAGGEPAFDGKDVFVPREALQAAIDGTAVSRAIYVTALSGTVNFWVTVS